jgi:hypothetical protein
VPRKKNRRNGGNPANFFSACRGLSDTIAIYDSGCSVHLTPYRRLLHDYVPCQTGEFICYGGNERTPILGIGTLVLKCVVQGKEILHRIANVRHVKSARRTLLIGTAGESRLLGLRTNSSTLIAYPAHQYACRSGEAEHPQSKFVI